MINVKEISKSVLAILLLSFTFVVAGTLTPASSPEASMYRLVDIYNKLSNPNYSAVQSTHAFTNTSAVGATWFDLDSIYNAIPVISPDIIRSGIDYFGYEGTFDAGPSYDVTWSTSESSGLNFVEATTYCDDLDEGGQTDWRLPLSLEAVTEYNASTTSFSSAGYWTNTSAPSSLVGLWHFNDDANDSTSNANHGSASNVTSVPGQFSTNAYSFNGSNSQVVVSTRNGINFAEDFSIAMWIYPVAYSGAWESILVWNYSPSADWRFSLRGDLYAPGQLSFLPQSGAAEGEGATVPLNEWSFVAVTVDVTNNRVSFFKNGLPIVEDFQSTDDIADTANTTFSIGNDFNGVIEEVTIWGNRLSASEVAALYSSSAETSGSPSKYYNDFSSGELISDSPDSVLHTTRCVR